MDEVTQIILAGDREAFIRYFNGFSGDRHVFIWAIRAVVEYAIEANIATVIEHSLEFGHHVVDQAVQNNYQCECTATLNGDLQKWRRDVLLRRNNQSQSQAHAFSFVAPRNTKSANSKPSSEEIAAQLFALISEAHSSMLNVHHDADWLLGSTISTPYRSSLKLMALNVAGQLSRNETLVESDVIAVRLLSLLRNTYRM